MSKILYRDMEISEKSKNALEKMGITEPSEIQEKTIPMMLDNIDLIAQSQTGSGKTLAFAIPIIEKINPKNRKNQALILCPTRELAQQIAKVFADLLAESKDIKSCCLYGGQSIVSQLDKLKEGVQILIGTPGRVIDHINRKSINLLSINTVVLDEADEMLNMGFKEDIETIFTFTNENKQTTMFSATMPKEILTIAETFLQDYKIVKVSKSLGVQTIHQEYIEVSKEDKIDALIQLIYKEMPKTCMIFCNTKKMVDEVNEKLTEKKFRAAGLHGDISQHERTKIMNDFKKGRTNILVCSDVAARGIDVNDVEFVINYDLPFDREYYTHRIGRTGRAGKSGVAISILTSSRHLQMIKQFAEYTNQDLINRVLPTKEEIYEAHIFKFIETINNFDFENIELNKFDDVKKEIVKRLYQTNKTTDEIIQFLLGKILIIPQFREVFNKVKYDKSRDRKTRENTPKSKTKKDFYQSGKMATLKIRAGRDNKLRPNHIVCAIVEETSIKANEIGKIVINDEYCLVDVPVKKEREVLEKLSKAKINRSKISVTKVN